jgi:hypothetical protein
MIKREKANLIFYAAPFLFFLFGFIAYSNIVNSFFISDDFSHMQRLFEYGPFAPFFKRCSLFYRPLFHLSMFIDYKIWKFAPYGFHITNILIHSLNSFFVFLITYLLVDYKTKYDSYRFVVAFVSGGLYLFLRSHAETVTWISDRADLLAAFFALAAFLGYYLYTVKNNFKYLVVSLSLFCCALFSKESVITLPLIVLFYNFFLNQSQAEKKEKFRRMIFSFMAFNIVFLFYLLARLTATGFLVGGYGKEAHLNFNYHLIFMNLIAYSARVFLPPSADIKVFFCAAISTIVLVITAFKIKKGKFPAVLYFIIFAYLISLLPVINLGTNFLKDTQGERFIYLPSVFLVMLVTMFLARIFQAHKKYFITVSLILIILSGIQLFQANKNWIIASKICKNIVDSVRQAGEADRLIIVNLPDNINGAYIFRNGFRQAIELFISPRQFRMIEVISSCYIFNEKDMMQITKKDNICLVRALNPDIHFINLNRRYVLSGNGNGFKFNLSKLDGGRILYYSSGKMEDVRF